MSADATAAQWNEITFLVSAAAVVYLVLLMFACVCDFLNTPEPAQDDLADIRMAFFSLRDSEVVRKVKDLNDWFAVDFACVRIFPSIAVCVMYVYNTYYQFISPLAHVLMASFGLFTLATLVLQIFMEQFPIRFVSQFEFVVEVLSCISLVLCRGSQWLNFSFFQAHIVQTRFLEVLPTLTALFWKKPQPHVEQKIRFLAIFIVHVYIFASGLQLFERLGDPFLAFRSTSLELTLWNALYFTFVTVFTVGYGDFIPYTLFGRFWMILVIMVGVLLVSYKISKFHELSLAFWSGQGSFVKRDGVKHIVICGNIKWEYLKAFVCEFYSDVENKEHQLVVMSVDDKWTPQEWAQFFTPHSEFERQVSFYRGSCMSEEDLGRAKVESASAVFVLNNQHNPNVYVEDSETLKRILTIRSYAPEVPIYSMCALTDSMFQIGYALEHASVEDTEAMSPEDSLFGDDGADGMVVLNFEGPTGPKSEAICMQDLEMSMLAGNVFCHGMSTLLSNLLLLTRPTAVTDEDTAEQPWMVEYKAGTENHLRFVQIPMNLDQITYREIALTLYDHGVVLLATKKYFDNVWKPVSPDAKLSHSSIGLVLTFLARIDLSSVLENIAEMVEVKTSVNSGTDQSVPMDELSHRTPSFYELAGRRLTGDGPNVLNDEFDELDGLYDGDGDLTRNTDEEGAEADDELDDVPEDDDEFFSDPPDHQGPRSIRNDPPFFAPRANTPEMAAHMPAALHDGPPTSANDNPTTPNDNPEEFSRAEGADTDSGDDVRLLGTDHDADLGISGVHAVNSREATDNDDAGSLEGTSPADQGRPSVSDDGPPSKGSEGSRVTFGKFSSIHEFETQTTDSPDRRHNSLFDRLRKKIVPARPTSSEQHIRHTSAVQSVLKPAQRPIPMAAKPLVPEESEKGLSRSLNLAVLPSVAAMSSSLGDFADDGGVRKDTAGHPVVAKGDAGLAVDDKKMNDKQDSKGASALGALSFVKTKFDGSGGNPSAVRFRRNREHDDAESSIVYPGQRSDSGPSEMNSADGEHTVPVYYGDMPLPSQYKNHILVCVIGQMGMMNLKQFLVRLELTRKESDRDQQVVAICPVVTDENILELSESELHKMKLCLIQGNSLCISTLEAAMYNKASTIVILACEDKGVVNHMDSNAIYTIMTLDHLIQENANIFVCSMIDSEESMHLLRAPNRERTRIGDLAMDANYRLQRRHSRASMRNIAAMGRSLDAQYGSMRSGLYSTMAVRRRSLYDMANMNSVDGRSYRQGGSIRQSRSFVSAHGGGGRRQDGRSISRTGTLEGIPPASMDHHDLDYLRRQQMHGGATILRHISTATLNKNGPWMSGGLSHVPSTIPPRPDTGNPARVVKKSRDAAFEKERYASGELMISSMFIALLIREFSMPGLTDVVGKLFGTRKDTQPCWVRSIPVPKAWIPTEEGSKGLEYRQLCEKLLEHACIPIGLYRCGAARVRVWYEYDEDKTVAGDEVPDEVPDYVPGEGGEEGGDGPDAEDEVFLPSPDLNGVHPRHRNRHSHLTRLRTRPSSADQLRPSRSADQLRPPSSESEESLHEGVRREEGIAFLDGGDAMQFRDEVMPEGLDTSPSAFSKDSEFDLGHPNRGEYHFVTSDRKVKYYEHLSGLNMLPYVYTNPEPYTVVSEHDAVYVLVNPGNSLNELK